MITRAIELVNTWITTRLG